VFSDLNPYVGHPNPLKEGQDLFRKGLLSEAVLALEAEVLKNPENAEGWRLLGIAHAENDDDQQVWLCLIDDKLPYLCRLRLL
jgi:peroxin-5